MSLVVIIILIFVSILWQVFRVKIKGAIGEKTTSSILYFLPNSKYKVINNVVLEIAGRTKQIDHVVVSDFGVFVIETKNYKGWILGGEYSEYWTQVIYKRKEQLYNPIRQNLGHIRALKSCLNEFPHLNYISIIVFPSKANLKVHTSTDVVYSYQLLKTIKRYRDLNILQADREAIVRRINALNLVATYNKRQHVKAIKQGIQRRNKSIQENKCPQCGGDLVKRNGRFGTFLGCNAYPGCRFTLNV